MKLSPSFWITLYYCCHCRYCCLSPFVTSSKSWCLCRMLSGLWCRAVWSASVSHKPATSIFKVDTGRRFLYGAALHKLGQSRRRAAVTKTIFSQRDVNVCNYCDSVAPVTLLDSGTATFNLIQALLLLAFQITGPSATFQQSKAG